MALGVLGDARLGELAEADSLLASAIQLFSELRGRTYLHIEENLSAAQLRIELLTAQGRYQEALTTAKDSIRRYDLQPSPRYAWPLLVGPPGPRPRSP